MNKKIKLEEVGGKEAVEFADKYKVNYSYLIRLLLAGYSLKQIEGVVNYIKDKIVRLLENLKYINLTPIYNSIMVASNDGYDKYERRCKNRQMLYDKRKKLGRVNKKRNKI